MTITAGRSDRPELLGKTTLERWLITMSLLYGAALVAALVLLLPGESSDESPSQDQEFPGAQSSSPWPQGGNARSSASAPTARPSGKNSRASWLPSTICALRSEPCARKLPCDNFMWRIGSKLYDDETNNHLFVTVTLS